MTADEVCAQRQPKVKAAGLKSRQPGKNPLETEDDDDVPF
jgi:hypothetical protein